MPFHVISFRQQQPSHSTSSLKFTEKFPLSSGRNLPNRLPFHIPPTNCSVLAVRDGEQNVSSTILMHAPSTRSFLSFARSFFCFLRRGPSCGRQHVKYCSEDKGNYLLEWEQWSSFAQTPKSDSECCNCLPLTLTVILLSSAVTEYFSIAFFRKLPLSHCLAPTLKCHQITHNVFLFNTHSLHHRSKSKVSIETTRKAAD